MDRSLADALKQAQERIEELEQQQRQESSDSKSLLLQSFINNLPDMAWIKNADSEFLAANKAFCRFAQTSEEQLIGNTCAVCFGEEAAEQFKKDDRSVMVQSAQRTIVEKIVDARSQEIWLETIKSPTLNDAGDPIGTVGVARDITERKRAEETLREREEQYQALLSGLPDIVMRFDREGRHLFVTENITSATGIESSEYLGKRHRDLGLPEAECQFWERTTRKVFETGRSLDGIECKCGQSIFSLRLVPEINREQEVESIIVIARDATALHRAEKKYRMLFREMLAGFAVTEILYDDQGEPNGYKFLDVNPAFERLTGLNAEEIIGRTVRDVLPQIESSWIEAYGRVALSGKPIFFESYVEGLGKYFEVSAFSPARDQFACVFVDVTERKQTAEAVQAKNRLLLSFINNLPDMAWIKNAGSEFLAANEAFCEAVQIPADVLANNTCEVCFGKEAASKFKRDDQVVMEKREQQTIVEKIVDGSGKEVWLETIKSPIFNEEGEPIGTVGVARDITERRRVEKELEHHRERLEEKVAERTRELSEEIVERKRVEKALRQSEHLARAILDATPHPLVILDHDGRVLDANQTSIAQFGGEDPRGRCFWELEPQSLTRGLRSAFDRVLSTGETILAEENNADQRVFESTLSPIQNGEGVDGVVALVYDITKRKQSEAERLELEARVHHSQKFESLGILAGGIAHDFNNLLAPIIGNADLSLQGLPKSSPMRRDLEEIVTAGRRAAALTNQMLAYTGKGQFVVSDIDLRILIEDMNRLLHSSVSKKVIINFDLMSELPAIRADESQIQQVVMNLVINASEAIGEARGIINVSARVGLCNEDCPCRDTFPESGEWSEQRSVILEVSDNGCGMDEDTRKKMFEPFFSTKFLGRGLGLASVHGILRRHEAGIEVESKPEMGTTVRVHFAALDHAASHQVQPQPHGQQLDVGGTVLLVDDDPYVRRMGERALDMLGFSVVTANDGLEAVEVFRARNDLVCVVMDLKMPNMDGEEACEKLRDINASIPVILSSGYSEYESMRRFGGRGIVGFLHKPYELKDLQEKLAEVLDVDE